MKDKRSVQKGRDNMSELKCRVENCVYNLDRLCCRGDICVGGRHAERRDQTSCDSFVRHREGMDIYTSSIAHPSETVQIDCEAEKCIYNRQYRCAAEHVDIRGLGAKNADGTSCESFTGKRL